MQFLSLTAFSAERRRAILDRVQGRVTAPREAFGLQSALRGSSTVIPLMGEIWRRSGTFHPWVTDVDEFREAVSAAAADAKTERIVLRIDSPGGSVDGLKEAAEAVAAANRVKPVTAVIEGMGASAAYYLASQAGRIVAGPMDLIGSIGTIIVVADFSGMFEEAGVRIIPIATGEFKATGIVGKEVTEADVAYLRGIVDAYGADFRAAVERGRRLSSEQVAKAADGRVWMTADAVRMGLIDGVGSLESVLADVARQNRVRAVNAEISILNLTRAAV